MSLRIHKEPISLPSGERGIFRPESLQDMYGAEGLLIALLATGSGPGETAMSLIGSFGWREAIVAILAVLANDPFAQMRTLAVLSDLVAAKPGSEREAFVEVLGRSGIHPLSVALGLSERKVNAYGWPVVDTRKAKGLAMRLGVSKELLRFGSQGALTPNAWPLEFEWTTDLRVISTDLDFYPDSKGFARDSMPSGIMVDGNLFAHGGAIRVLPAGLVVTGDLNLSGCDQWDGRVPKDALIGGKILTTEIASHGTGVHDDSRGITLSEWRCFEILVDELVVKGADPTDARIEAGLRVHSMRRAPAGTK